ncbi:hypothetical protein [Paenibacillus gallinarum]|uniref:Cardiolipin synthase N-terminal domain-containing protein n=1 Tax=Paenibacillus gallinarum TaxID=2762232 RepID=A0ABR8T303_9BACL|nr:hypothetical protein [Paenibacillus gallinarum]MBD7970158.1 hypothetical protein [Paenibacillus gallinarum]
MLNNDPYVTPERDTPPEAPIVSVKSWMLVTFLVAIPIVNLIFLFIWAFSSSTNPNKSNFAKASLLWMAIGIVIYIVGLIGVYYLAIRSN